MAKVSRFEIEPCNDSRNVKTEIDDVFDEIVERRVKIENESDDVFDEGFERKVHVASPELNLKNKLTLTVKLLCQEEEDDVFDEEREKAENALTRLGNTGIKVELIEDKVNDLKENLDSLTNIIKEEKIMMSNTEDIQSFIEFVKQEIKVEEDIEAERINEYNCPKCTFKTTQRAILENHSLSHTVENSRKDDTGMASQFEVDQNNINVNNIFEMIGHSSIGGGKKEADLKISKEKIVREKQIETNKIKLREQNANTFVDNTRDAKKLKMESEMCNFIESVSTSNRKRSSRDKQQKENSTKSCSKNVENVENITGKEATIDRIPKQISEKTISSNGASNIDNRDTIKECRLEVNKSQRENDGQEPSIEKNQSVSVSNKTLNEEEERKCHEKKSDKRQKRLHKEMERSETIIVSKEKSLDRSKQNDTVTSLSSNLLTIKNVVNNDAELENIEYCCTKCSFRTKQRTMFKAHLVKHGTEFCSGVISFLDLVNETVTTNQVETLQDQDEMKEQCTVGIHNTVHDEVQTDDEEKLEIEDEVEACKSSQSSCEITGKNGNRATEIGDNQQYEFLNVENYSICKRSETTVSGKENEGFLTVEKYIESILENSGNQNQAIQIINKNISSEIKLLESETENKRKVDSQNENGEVLNENNNTVINVIDKEKEETSFSKNEEDILKGVSNVDSIFENMKNAIMENQCNQILKTDEVSLRLAETNKRKSVEEPTSPSKKIRLENDKIYRCGECSYQTHKKKYFDNHKIIHSKDVIKCHYCSFTTKLQRYMNSHMLVHLQPEEIKMYKCPHCSYQTKRRGDLPVHMVMHKKPEEVQMFHCDSCSYKTKRKSNLRTHRLGHKSADDVTLYSCTICSFTAKKKYTVKSHMIVHQKMEDIHWYKCDKCSYSSKHKSGLKRHDLVHKNLDEIKTYDCPTCHYKAKHKSHLKSHLLIHKDPTEVEMHHCSHCAYKSIKKCNLVAHMLQHKKIEEINMKKCEHCPYQTKLKCNLIKHLNRIHRRPVV